MGSNSLCYRGAIHRLILRIFAAAGVLVFPSCVGYTPRLLEQAITAMALERRGLESPGLRDYLKSEGVSVADWPLRRWSLEQVAAAGRFFHPDLAVPRAQAETAWAALTTAGERPNPTLSFKPGPADADHRPVNSFSKRWERWRMPCKPPVSLWK